MWDSVLAKEGSNDSMLSPDDPFQINVKTVITMVLTSLCALLANAAGIGGGPIYLPLLMVSLQPCTLVCRSASGFVQDLLSASSVSGRAARVHVRECHH